MFAHSDHQTLDGSNSIHLQPGKSGHNQSLEESHLPPTSHHERRCARHPKTLKICVRTWHRETTRGSGDICYHQDRNAGRPVLAPSSFGLPRSARVDTLPTCYLILEIILLFRYIEALSFAHYLGHGTLVTFTQVQSTLSDNNGIPVGGHCPFHHVPVFLTNTSSFSVLSAAQGRLFAWIIRSHWRAYEVCDLRYCAQRRTHSGASSVQLCQGMQIRQAIPLQHFIFLVHRLARL
jgi:hypothetical protein